MTKIIGVDAAKLAGLQIDLLQKLRDQQMTIEHLKWYLGLRKEERDALMEERRPHKEKFTLLADLGIITIPNDYTPTTAWTGMIFPNPSHVLEPGDELLVRAYKQVLPGTRTSKECMAFLEEQEEGNVLLGVQGTVLAETMRLQLPKGFSYYSFDWKKYLPFFEGFHYVPALRAETGGEYRHNLGIFERRWLSDRDALLGFSRLQYRML
ncbi:MAG: hypothetical protein UX49_C0038G0005 [Candidatus Wolfebacteria bacterium GW2011_GWC2_46_275]|nr:MAG: hypothetical protein UX49_C0038G0005 [Candidatus Wolfebacteria bacterium GW2011_GWC2_46_275]KKU70943.1 MAG: hypothetical protein UX96_C0031G0003 [Candidatus Wolfebacteria bacterium GW2011_GWB1_47_243]